MQAWRPPILGQRMHLDPLEHSTPTFSRPAARKRETMRLSGNMLKRSIAAWLTLLLAVPLGEAATSRVRLPMTAQQTTAAPSGQPPAGTQAPAAQAQPGASPSNSGTSPQTTPVTQKPAPTQPSAQPQNNTNPVGTAAAPYVKALGVPASRPAGAAIAPAKQKRAHSFLIKVGVLVGAAIAVGAVVGLSKTSPSRPN